MRAMGQFEATIACPSQEQLSAYLSSECDEAQAVAIGMHVENCQPCSRRLEELQASDGVYAGLRQMLESRDGQAGGGGVHCDAPTLTTGDPSMPLDARVRAGATEPTLEGYEILEEIGRGGMGAVYLAFQKSTRRKVALKVLLEGPFASATARRRFEREVELAAQLDHPRIVTILESGIASGRYYFAMQYVQGCRLDEYVTARGRGSRDILPLFASVCEAVNYAHQRGVIHRDLKPSNVIVDQTGEPHVLDFGLAKVAEPDGGDEGVTQLSMPGQVMGTLPYMSPEQAGGAHQDMDIRTDVYSLGVILYELLTGRYPYPVTGRIFEVLGNIAHTEPVRPALLNDDVDDEIETIVLKALAKEKDRRYQTAGDLAGDVRSYLAGEPIAAKRDSNLYVLRKMLWRYRYPVLAAAVLLPLLIVGGVRLATQKARLNVAEGADRIAAFVPAPAEVMGAMEAAPSAVRASMVDAAARFVQSPAYTERVMGARSAFLLSPEAFWRSMDGGRLWQHGEWLELCRSSNVPVKMPVELTGRFLPELNRKAGDGTDRQRYAAFCLLGDLAQQDEESLKLCADAVRSSNDPGVVLAAWWAAARLGREMPLASSPATLVDDLSRLVFVRVPASRKPFRRGSPPEEPHRYDDEDRPAAGVSIDSFYLATTEVTLAAFEPFFSDFQERDAAFGMVALGDVADPGIPGQLARVPEEQHGSAAVGYVSPIAAKRYCDWLNRLAAAKSLNHRYRLPTEEEWEYACRANNSSAFCFGDDARYLGSFARCDGYAAEWHTVAQCMPNSFGLFDMHGGLWELCDSRYSQDDAKDVAESGPTLYVQRGGAYYSAAVRCRSAQRNYCTADAESQWTGFRIVLELEGP